MKKWLLLFIILSFVVAAVCGWLLFGPATTFSGDSKYLYIKENRPVTSQVMEQLDTSDIIRSVAFFNFMATQTGSWDNVRSGRFKIEKNQNLFTILRTFRNNRQSEVKVVINKLRVREDIARVVGKNLSTDSLEAIQFLSNQDSLHRVGVDSNSLMTLIIPDTYFFNWNTSTKDFLQRLKDEQEKFWEKNQRIEKAGELGFSPQQVYILASIVEEETNKNDEKGKVASVYINRLRLGMPLGADPTIKFALKNFQLKRILFGHLNVESPYNTYRNAGLPPGPICTPSIKSIDAVLDAPETDYIFFVANSDFSGYHKFSNSYAQHQRYAKEYQKALNEWLAKKEGQKE